MNSPIKFGTDGWRAIIAEDYTVENVKRVSYATALFMKKKGLTKVVIGHDTRFAGELFANTAAQVLASQGIRVQLAKGFVTTPMVSLGVVKTKSGLGIVITASHNPPSYNGFKLKSMLGGPSVPADIAEVEALIPNEFNEPLPSIEEMLEEGLLSYIDLEDMYMKEVNQKIDLPTIWQSNLNVAYDAMYGAGQNAMVALIPELTTLRCTYNPSFMGQAPEPIARNLGNLSFAIKAEGDISLGIANDGDADRIGLYDDLGNFIDSHHILLILVHYLHKYKGQTGKVIITFSVTDKVKRLCEHYGLDYQVTKIGFKYIAEIMETEDVLVGGEESGGIAVKGHIPERDGIWCGLLILEFMASTGKGIREIIQEIYDIVGTFATDRLDLHLSEAQKTDIIAKCQSKAYTKFGSYNVGSIETLDGYKFNLSENDWVMIRPSGTEPVLRIYAQAPTAAAAKAILEATRTEVLGEVPANP
jgi:phosphomannomutase